MQQGCARGLNSGRRVRVDLGYKKNEPGAIYCQANPVCVADLLRDHWFTYLLCVCNTYTIHYICVTYANIYVICNYIYVIQYVPRQYLFLSCITRMCSCRYVYSLKAASPEVTMLWFVLPASHCISWGPWSLNFTFCVLKCPSEKWIL
jgi:hypothetical protein